MAKDKENMEPEEGIKGLDRIENTTMTNLSDIIKLKMDQLKDLASLEVMLDVGSRLKHRLESIRKMSSAQHLKIDGHWKTTPPQMHIVNLTGRKLDNNTCEIRFGVFETDDKGNKKLHTHSTEIELYDGSKMKRVVSAEYRVAYEVVETIQFRQPIKREVIRILEK